MKLIEVKREYGLNQNTFYGWLRENQMIIKEMTGMLLVLKLLRVWRQGQIGG